MGWIFLGVLAALAACVLWLRHLHRDKQRQEELARRMRSSRTYTGLRTMLVRVPRKYIEQVKITPEEVSVLLLNGRRMVYNFEERDTDPIRHETLPILVQCVAADLPEVLVSTYYTYRRSRRTNAAGQPEPVYSYTMRPKRKSFLLRAMKEPGRL